MRTSINAYGYHRNFTTLFVEITRRCDGSQRGLDFVQKEQRIGGLAGMFGNVSSWLKICWGFMGSKTVFNSG